MKDFHGKVAAITGAGSGIGRALAIALAGRGCHLALSDVNAEGLAETARLAKANPVVRITTAVVNVADRTSVYAWAESVGAEHGQVNLVFNNAGVALGSTVAGVSYEDFEWLMNINFWGVVYGTKAFLPLLEASGEGHVVNVSSIFGIAGVPSQSAYNAAKFAVRGFTEALRQELEVAGSRVSATCVHPGGIKTNIAKSARIKDEMSASFLANGAGGPAVIERLFINTPEYAAEAILRGVRRNARRVLIGWDAQALDILVRLLPSAYQALIGGAFRRLRRTQEVRPVGVGVR